LGESKTRVQAAKEKRGLKDRLKIVRKRCIDFILALKKYGYANEIPLESAKILFSQNGFGFDRFTIKAYFGS
jgi:hypothetical protein